MSLKNNFLNFGPLIMFIYSTKPASSSVFISTSLEEDITLFPDISSSSNILNPAEYNLYVRA